MSDTPTPTKADEKAKKMTPTQAEKSGAIAMLGGIHGVALIRHIRGFRKQAQKEYHTPLYPVTALRPEVEPVAGTHHPDFDDGYQWVRNIRASPPAPAVKVKALKWKRRRRGSDDFYVETDMGEYCAGLVHGSYVAIRRSIRDAQLHDEVLKRGLGLEDAKAAAQADYEARIRSALLPPEEAQAATPAEALPSQSGVREAVRKLLKAGELVLYVTADDRGLDEDEYVEAFEKIAATLAKPASEPAGGGVRAMVDRFDIHRLRIANRKPSAKRDEFLAELDFIREDICRAALSSPASSSPAEAAGVDAELQELRAKVAMLSSGDCIACNGSGAIQDGAECSTCNGTGAHGSLARAHLLRAMAGAEALPAGVGATWDDIAVDRFAYAMKAKLAKKRAEGRGGWDRKIPAPGIDGRGFYYECPNSFLSTKLREHVDKGDPVDVANFAMMIHQRGERIG